MKCERCGAEAKGYDLFDCCAECSKNLCKKCMTEGCCGHVPAHSGYEDEEMSGTDSVEYDGGGKEKGNG